VDDVAEAEPLGEYGMRIGTKCSVVSLATIPTDRRTNQQSGISKRRSEASLEWCMRSRVKAEVHTVTLREDNLEGEEFGPAPTPPIV